MEQKYDEESVDAEMDVIEKIKGENAEAINVNPEEYEDMTIREWERLYQELNGPLETPPGCESRQERRRRTERVEAILDPEESVRRVKWKHRWEDFYTNLEYMAETGKEFAGEARDFAYDIKEMLDPTDRE